MSRSFDPTKPVKTRDGRQAEVLKVGAKLAGLDETVIALVDGVVKVYHTGGNFLLLAQDPRDLVNIPEERVEYRRVLKKPPRAYQASAVFTVSGMQCGNAAGSTCGTHTYDDGEFKLTYIDDKLMKMERVE